jgi:hypothetical protein
MRWKERGFEAFIQTRIGAKLVAKHIYGKAMEYAKKASESIKIDITPFFLINEDIKHIKMSQFITCDTTGDYSCLVLAGEPRESDLKEAWERILIIKADATKDTTVGGYTKLTSKIQVTALHIANVENIVSAFKIHYDERFAVRLRELGYEYEYTPESYLNDLKIVEGELIGHTERLDDLRKEHERLYPKQENKKMTEDEYMSTIDEIISWRKLSIAPTTWAETNTVYDYCIAIGKFRAYVDKMNEAHNKDN